MLIIRLFGSLTIEQDAQRVLLPASVQARDLLACLALSPQRKFTRSALIGIFWPDESEEHSRRALSQALWHIRRLFPELVIVEAETISLNPQAEVWVDVQAFERAVQTWLPGDHLSPEGHLALAQAIDLYRGDLLESNYNDWALLERERLRGQYQQVLEKLLMAEKSNGAFEQALEYGLRLLQSDSLRETVHRDVMRLQHLLGRPEAALRQFEICRHALKEELNLDPEPETLALAQEIARRDKAGTAPYLPQLPPAQEAWHRSLPLVGRQAERAFLLAHVEAALQKRGAIVLLEGEAGIGKTRLLQEIARDAEWRGAQVLWSSGLENGTPPFQPLLAAINAGLSPLRIRQIRQALESPWLQALHPHIPQLLGSQDELQNGPSLSAQLEHSRFVEALTALLKGWAMAVPLIFILDDLHWLDADTLSILPDLATRSNQSGVLWLAAYRVEEVRARQGVWEQIQAMDRAGPLGRLELNRLDQNATGELIRVSLGLRQSAPLFEARLYQETDGNPFFVLETLRSLQDEGLLSRQEEDRWKTPWDEATTDYTELPLPPQVERVIARRLEMLSQTSRKILHSAAILGSQPDYEALQALSRLEVLDFLEVLRDLTQRHFLEETDSGYRFNHDKILQVVYGEIEPADRKRLHHAAGEALEALQPEQVNELARHFTCADEFEKSAHYSLLAAGRAAAMYANRQAIAFYHQAWQALNLCDESCDSPRRMDLLIARASLYNRIGQRESQKTDLEALDHILSDPAAQARQHLRWAKYYEAVSDYPGVIKAAQRTIESASALNDKALMAAGQILLGRALNMQAHSQEAEAILKEALQNACLSGDDALQAASAFGLARIYYDYQNRYAEAFEHCRRALEIYQSRQDLASAADTLQLMGGVLTDLGNIEEALECKQEALAIRRKIGDRRGESNALYSLAIYYRDRGDFLTSLEYSRQAAAIAQAVGERRTEAYARTYIGINLEESDPRQSLEEYQRALEIRRAIGQHAVAVDTLAGLARASLKLGRNAEALAYIQEALSWVEANGTFGVGDLGLVYLAAYDTFMTAGEQEHARQVICAAYDNLMKRAETISNDSARQRFLTNLPQHCRVIKLYHMHLCRTIQVVLPALGQAGKTQVVTWSMDAPGDTEITGKVARRRQRLKRLLREAKEQGAEPTYQHLADALQVSIRTIERDMAEMGNE